MKNRKQILVIDNVKIREELDELGKRSLVLINCKISKRK